MNEIYKINYLDNLVFKLVKAKRLLSAIAIASALSTASFQPVLAAEEDKGFYSTIGIGAHFPSDLTGDTTYWGPTYSGTEYHDGGFAGEIGLGYDWGNDWRMDFTYGKAWGEITKANYAGVNATLQGADYSVNFLKVGLNRDITFQNSSIKPYVGAGVGIGWSELSDFKLTLLDITFDGSGGTGDAKFIYNFKAGVAAPVSERADLFGEVSYTADTGGTEQQINYDPWGTIALLGGIRVKF